MKTLLSIDPGALGAVVCLSAAGLRIEKMPETPKDLLELLEDMTAEDCKLDDLFCLVENVGGYRPGNSGPSAVKFARHVGHIDMALLAAEIPHERVAPSTWMKVVLKTVPSDKTKRKNAIKAEMQRRFPKEKVTLWNADALGMLCYLMEKEK